MPSTSFPAASKFPLGPPASAGCAGAETLGPARGTMKSAEEDHYSCASSSLAAALPLPPVHASLPAQCHELQPSGPGLVTSHAMGYGGAVDGGPSGYFLPGSVRPNGAPPLESPRIEITPYLGLHPHGGQFLPDVEAEDVLPGARRPPATATLHLPHLDTYRDPSCLSPASSVSSRSCNSEASSYESSCSYTYASPQTSPWQSPCVSPKTTEPEEGFPRGLGACGHSPCASPRASVTEESWLGARCSQPPSPCPKRKHGLDGRPLPSPQASPAPSPHGSPRVSVTDESWLGSATQFTSSAIVAAINALSTDSLDLGDGVPVKARRTALEPAAPVALKVEPAAEGPATPPSVDFSPEEFPGFQHLRKGALCDQYLSVPQPPYPWARPRSPTGYTSPALPALDWQLPAHSGPYELRIEVQPKSHHRAHYETEGSRGAVKASAGGHPSVQLHGYLEKEPLTLQLFIGTADERLLRPHAFYQVHRITGKTVSTTSHEALLSNTKVLEIPLLPENHMRAIIDCAGILKLRNSDIELRKGETDIGRKNTRVRLVFRVHIPQPGGRTLSLQVASNPIECSQRSAQELPLVEKQSTASGPAQGGKRMVLSGHNFLQDSKVVFVEKAPDGHHVWEMDAKTDRDLCKGNSLVVEVPPFRNPRISSPVQVSFYVCNGKRKRSQYQHFTYLPALVPAIKTEPSDDYEPALPCGPLGPLPKACYSQQLALPPEPPSCLVTGFPACPQGSPLLSPPPSASPKLHTLSSVPYKALAGPGPCQLGLPPPAAPGALPVPGPELHPSSPQPPAPSLLQPQPCSPACPPKAPPSASPAAGPLPLPEVHRDGDPSLAPVPLAVKREPRELDQLDLDDVNEVIRNDLSSATVLSS
ncbi:nuclear factor of activated T-cells, cytoplasmic 1 isoform X2 [Sorex araneus]|uniref:nuclear factor of activated T-cells, cytoplasmic 1 isoform X2 n=1 Tax=Sorex araneus TaxID=42254 RepID=UPI00243374B8|nr:nuclear factor of activated T-cells, cytoplasmic 1 isoform X2 [Sorex araneus]